MSRSAWQATFRAFDSLVARHEFLLVPVFVLWPIVRSFDLLSHRLNFDELMTFSIASLPTVDAVLKAVPPDGNPPLYHLLAGLSLRFFGPIEFATRLPSVLSFVATSLCLYIFVRRRCSAIAALLALFSFGVTEAAGHAFTGRPYMLLLAFTMVAMVSWQSATARPSKRGLALAGIAVGVAGAIASHHFGAVHVGVPLAAGELCRLVQRRRLDLPIYLSGLVGVSMLALTVPLMEQTNIAFLAQVKASANFFAVPRLGRLTSYADMANGWLLATFAVSAFITGRFLPKSPSKSAGDAIPGHEIVAAAGLAALVPIVLAVTAIATGYYQPRYAIGSSVGIAILLGFAASGLWKPLRINGAAAALCLSVLVVVFAAQELRVPLAKWRGRHVGSGDLFGQSLPVLDAAPAGKPIVVASAEMYPLVWQYSPPGRRGRLHYLSDLSFAAKLADPLAELTLVGELPFVPFKVEDYGAFLARHGEFYLYCMTAPKGDCIDDTTWIRDRLESEGHALTPVARTESGLLLHVARK